MNFGNLRNTVSLVNSLLYDGTEANTRDRRGGKGSAEADAEPNGVFVFDRLCVPNDNS